MLQQNGKQKAFDMVYQRIYGGLPPPTTVQELQHRQEHALDEVETWRFFHDNANRIAHLNEQHYAYKGLTCPFCIFDQEDRSSPSLSQEPTP